MNVGAAPPLSLWAARATQPNTAEPTGSVQASWGAWGHPCGIAHAKTGAANSKIRKWPEMAAAAIFADRRLTGAGVRCGGYGAAAGRPTARQQLWVPPAGRPARLEGCKPPGGGKIRPPPLPAAGEKWPKWPEMAAAAISGRGQRGGHGNGASGSGGAGDGHGSGVRRALAAYNCTARGRNRKSGRGLAS